MTKASAVTVALLLLAAPLFAARVEKRTLQSGGRSRSYSLFVPDGLAAPAPLLVTLHGSGRKGDSLVEAWRGLAQKSGVIVAGPDSAKSEQWESPVDGPQLLHDVIEEVKKNHPVDGRRVYLFGHSAGANFALQMGLIQSEYFAAVAVHAGALTPGMYPLIGHATRRIPLAVWVGTKDAYVPVISAREGTEELRKHGFAAELTEIPRHTHDYYGRYTAINPGVWAFLEKHALPADARYTVYQFE